MLEIRILRFDELPEEINKDCLSNNGAGKEWSSYLTIWHNGQLVDWYSDAMEPEDVSFTRDLSWIKDALEEVYKLGSSGV